MWIYGANSNLSDGSVFDEEELLAALKLSCFHIEQSWMWGTGLSWDMAKAHSGFLNLTFQEISECLAKSYLMSL